MQPAVLLVTFACLWALIHLWLLPLSTARWKSSDLQHKMARTASQAVLTKVRDLAAIGALTLACVLALVTLAELLSDRDAGWSAAVIEAATSLYGRAKSFSDAYGNAVGMVGLLGAGVALWLAARQARRRVADVWMQKASAEHNAFCADPSLLDQARQVEGLAPWIAAIDEAIAAIARADAASDAQAVDSAKAALGRALTDLSIEKARRDVDFPEAAGQPTTNEQTGPRTVWHRVLTALSSKRFSADVGLVKKPLGWVISALLFVSLIGWCAEPMATSLRLSVNNLRVHANAQLAQRELEAALSRPSDPELDRPPSEAQASAQVAARLVARAALHDLSRQRWLATPALERAPRAQAEFVRNALAGNEIAVPAGADSASRLRAEVAASMAQGSKPSTPAVEAAAERIQPVLEDIRRKQPDRFAAMVARLEARYGASMSPIDAQSKLLGRVIDDAFGVIDAKLDTELAKQAQKLGKDLGKKSIETWADAALKRVVADALTASTIQQVRESLALEISDDTARLLEALRSSESHGWQAGKAAAHERTLNEKVAQAAARMHVDIDDAERAALARQLAGYEATFVRDHGWPTWEPPSGPAAGGPGGGEVEVAVAAPAEAAAAAAPHVRPVIPVDGRQRQTSTLRCAARASGAF